MEHTKSAADRLADKVATYTDRELVEAAKDLNRRYPVSYAAPDHIRITMGAIAQELRQRWPNPFQAK